MPVCPVALHNIAKHTFQLHKQLSEDGQEARLYCLSEKRAKKEAGISQRFSERFETALEQMSAGLSRPRTTKRVDKLWERIGRLKEKSHGE